MEHKHESDGAMNSRANIAWTVFLAVAAFSLLVEHRAQLLEWFPYWSYMVLLASPLMHLFMHGGHGHGGHRQREASGESDREKK